jgi:hypothetical protein
MSRFRLDITTITVRRAESGAERVSIGATRGTTEGRV